MRIIRQFPQIVISDDVWPKYCYDVLEIFIDEYLKHADYVVCPSKSYNYISRTDKQHNLNIFSCRCCVMFDAFCTGFSSP